MLGHDRHDDEEAPHAEDDRGAPPPAARPRCPAAARSKPAPSRSGRTPRRRRAAPRSAAPGTRSRWCRTPVPRRRKCSSTGFHTELVRKRQPNTAKACAPPRSSTAMMPQISSSTTMPQDQAIAANRAVRRGATARRCGALRLDPRSLHERSCWPVPDGDDAPESGTLARQCRSARKLAPGLAHVRLHRSRQRHIFQVAGDPGTVGERPVEKADHRGAALRIPSGWSGSSTKVAETIGQAPAPGVSSMSTAKSFAAAQSAPAAALEKLSRFGSTYAPAASFSATVVRGGSCRHRHIRHSRDRRACLRTTAATPSLPRAPAPAGQAIEVLAPTLVFHAVLALAR